MRDYTIKHVLVIVLSAIFGGVDTFASVGAKSPAATSRGGAASVVSGTIGEATVGSHTIPLAKGREYRIEATCARGCGGMRLRLFSPGGVELDRHVGATEQADVATIPAGSGRYRVDLSMTGCPTSPCAYEVAVYPR